MPINQIGLSSYSCSQACRAGLTPMDLVKKAAALSVSVVQMADNIHLENYSDSDLLTAAHCAADHNIQIETGFRGLIPENIPKYFEISRILNARLLRFVIDAPGYTPSIDEVYHILKNLEPQLDAGNQILGLETHDRFSAPELAELMRRVGSPRIGIVLDTANNLSNEERATEVAEELAEFTVCFHAKDYIIRRRKTGMGLETIGVPAGEGRLPLEQILTLLNQRSPYLFSVILEIWVEEYSTSAEALALEEQWIDRSFRNLHSIVKKVRAS